MELDLNEEPLDQTPTSVIEFDSILNELESTHGHIEDRIRHLEAVTSRARQRQRWRRGGRDSVRISNIVPDMMMMTPNAQDESRMPLEDVERTTDNRKKGKRNSAHLVAKALGMDPYIDNEASESRTGNFFECYICLDTAKDPILTCCGHLFCWPCFYQVSCAYKNVRECPVCKGEVSETGIIPIYGNEDDSSNSKSKLKEAGLTVPPRPQACRIEGFRQKLISRGTSSSTVQDIRWFNNNTGVTITDGTRHLVNQSRHSQSQELPRMETEDGQLNRSHQLSRLLVEGAASFSSLSSALNSAMDSAERLVGDLEAYIHPQQPQPGGRIRQQLDPSSHLSILPPPLTGANVPWSHTPDVAATNSAASTSISPPGMNDNVTAVINSGIQTTDSSVQISSMEPSSSSSRTVVLGLPDIYNRVSNGRRRRRVRR
ncbi:E3 ubiquitin-protein ligase RMA3 [Senna tora]|uniref:E3 ubiquitin-protein ligase RMA n=1 Tax=Senna tora TaxID=362788 RepID=A0A834TP60_9FABA|nr:E3 ubiquitin-protein ligase RMA3 [Senna tora]